MSIYKNDYYRLEINIANFITNRTLKDIMKFLKLHRYYYFYEPLVNDFHATCKDILDKYEKLPADMKKTSYNRRIYSKAYKLMVQIEQKL